jgi:hypothetical protein
MYGYLTGRVGGAYQGGYEKGVEGLLGERAGVIGRGTWDDEVKDPVIG